MGGETESRGAGASAQRFQFARTCIVLQSMFITKLVTRILTPILSAPDKMDNSGDNGIYIGVIGCGGVGRAIVENLIIYAGVPPNRIKISSRRPEKLGVFSDRGIECMYDNGRLFSTCSLVFLCVPPGQLSSVAHDVQQYYMHLLPLASSLKQSTSLHPIGNLLPTTPKSSLSLSSSGTIPLSASQKLIPPSPLIKRPKKPLVCSVVCGVKPKKISQMFDADSVHTLVHFSNFNMGLESIYLSKPKTKFPREVLVASLPVPNISPPSLSTESSVSYIHTLTSSLALLVCKYLPKSEAVHMACGGVLGTDIGLEAPDVLDHSHNELQIDDNQELVIYRVSKGSSEVILEAFKRNYLATLDSLQ